MNEWVNQWIDQMDGELIEWKNNKMDEKKTVFKIVMILHSTPPK